MSKEKEKIKVKEQQKTIDNKKKEEFKENKENKDSNENKNNELVKDKINKPNDLKNFDAVTHFKQNIIRFDKNCSEPVKDYSYYCFSCKHSVCNECGVYDHKEHLLIQRDNCLNYDSSFFNEISKVIEKGINIDIKKDQIKKDISKSIKELKDQLDLLENEKLKEIDYIFEEIKKNYINLKENYLKTKECIENYYKINKNFFNIKIKITNQDNNNNEIENINNNIKKSSSDNPYLNYLNDNEIGPNRDMDNTIFLMNFELMNLCDNKNLQILEISNEINNKIANISNKIEEKTNFLKNEIKNNYLDFDTKNLTSKFDDFYWDIKMRCEKYNEHISHFKDIILDIYRRNGSFDKLKDLLSLFDSKNHKGKDVLFNQQFFIKMNDLSGLNSDKNKTISKSLYKTHGKKRSNSKKSLIRQNSQNNTIKSKENRTIDRAQYNNSTTKGIDKYNNKNNTINNDSKNLMKRSNSNLFGKNMSRINTINTNKNIIMIDKDNIILDQRVLQRFFAYSILDFYSKYFKIINYDDEDNESYDIHNIYNNNKNESSNKSKSKNNSKKKNKNKNAKNSKNINDNKYHINNIKIIKDKSNENIFGSNNANLLESNINNNNKNKRINQNKNIIKSASLISNYSERYMELKEKVKPLIGTNYIQFFEPATNRITRVQIPLTKESHGYTTFPEGCRHILIDSELFITGGSDNCGYPINIVLMLNIENGELTRLSNLNDNHSYHSLDYLENYDCIILVGGENSSSCEIMDIDSKKWTKLPSLNYPRANSNIYYNNATSDLFVLFGMEKEMNEKTQNTDVIEVLELNDIIGGWIKVDYYKSVGFDMKNNYCVTLPFTRDKLIVYGGTTARSLEKRIFALFDMIKNEIIKVDSKTMDLIKLEENKIRSFDTALEKFLK